MLFASVATGVRQGNVAGFPAIRTVVESICAHAHVVLAFADGAILLAGAALFRHIAHRAKDGTGHGSLQGKLYLTMARRGKAGVASMRRVVYPAIDAAENDFSSFARLISLALSASLTRFGVRASIDFCPEPSEWKQPTRPSSAKPARRRSTRCTVVWARKWSILTAGTCPSSIRRAGVWWRSTRRCAEASAFSMSATWATFASALGARLEARSRQCSTSV